MLQTANYNLKKLELKDSPPDIEAINPNWDIIDVELKKAADLKSQYDALRVGAVNLKNFTDFNKISVLDDTTEWQKGGSGSVEIQRGINIGELNLKNISCIKIINTQSVATYLSSGLWGKGYIIQAKPNTDYTFKYIMRSSTIIGTGARGSIMARKADGTFIKSQAGTFSNSESLFKEYILTLKTTSDTSFLEFRFEMEGIGSAWFYQPMLVEGNKIVEGWSPSLADIDREIKAAQANIDNIKLGVRNLVWNTDFDNMWTNFNTSTSLSKTDDGQKLVWSGTGQSAITELLTLPLIPDRGYTLTFEARGNLKLLQAYILGTTSLLVLTQYDALSLTEFRKFSVTFKYTSAAQPSKRLFLGGSPSLVNEWLEIKKDSVMLVEGNKAPEDWIPAPEDVKYDSVGVRNLLSNGDFTKGTKGWSSGSIGTIFKVVESDSSELSKNYLETSKNNISIALKLSSVKKGDKITVSFRARQSAGGAFNPKFRIIEGDLNYLSNYIYFTLTSSWKYYSFTFPAEMNGNLYQRLYLYGSGDDTKLLQITDIKVELGTHPTGYIPSTEDINEVIALKENGGSIGSMTININGSTFDTLKTSKANLALAVANSKGVIIDQSGVRKGEATGDYNMGSSSYPWNMIYGKNLNLNGTLTTDTSTAGIDYFKTTKNLMSLSSAVGSVIIDETCFRVPSTLKGAYDLGVSAYPWNIIYGNILNIGGTLELKSLSSIVDEVKTSKGYLNLLADGAGITIDKANNVIRPNSGFQGVMNLGSIDFRFKDIFLSGATNLSNGYTKLPNGFILQWGTKLTDANVVYSPVTFPVAFKEDVYCVIATNFNTELSEYQPDVTYSTSLYTLTSFRLWPRRASVHSATAFTTNCRWVAIGR